jgi:osomolarity two-component system sensor histidine kinase TcsA
MGEALKDSGLSTPVTPRLPVSSTDISSRTAVAGHSMITLPLRNATAPLKTTEPRLAQILALTPVPSIVLDPKQDIVEVSKSYLSLTSTTWDECVGFNVYKSILDKNPGADCVSLRHAFEKAIGSRGVYTIDDLHIAFSKYWRVRLVPIFDGEELLFVVLEAEEHSSSRAHYIGDGRAHADEMYRILVNNVKDYAIFMLDVQGHITTWNAGASILKQYGSEDIIGQHFSIFYGDEDVAAKKPQRELEICMREGKVEDEGWRYKKDGSRFWASVMIAPVYNAGQHIGFSKVTRDITERKAGEARLIAAFEEAENLKSNFLANMSHEMRTPMHGMLAASSLLMESNLTDEQNELAHIIEESGGILLQVINDILDYSKIASGSFTVTATTISVPDIISAVVRAAQVTLRPNVLLETEAMDAFPKNVESDPLRFRQVLQNVVGNAVKFTEQGSVRIFAKISAEDDVSYTLLIEVIDTGIGVSPSAVETLFTPFAPANAVAKQYQGTGLGLSICKGLVESMGGTIGFRPNEDKGSTFWFTTKLAKITLLPVAPSPTQQLSTKLTDTALTKQILVVEDNVINQTIMMKLLKGYGFKYINVASNGKEGLELVQKAPLAYRLVLMDINMPVMDGITATEMIRGMGLDVPIIAMTANALKGDEELYLASGMNDYVAKPVNRRTLLRALVRWIDH